MERPVGEIVYLGIGSNLQDRLLHMRWAVEQVNGSDCIEVVAASQVYESEAHVLDAEEAQPAYLNAVVSLRCNLEPPRLLRLLNKLEKQRGRDRANEKRWASRTLDLDILAFGNRTIESSKLHIPHRRIAQRKFVLAPWADIAPDFFVPGPYNQTISVLLTQCMDNAILVKTSHKLLD